jgi:hypothetical protein
MTLPPHQTLLQGIRVAALLNNTTGRIIQEEETNIQQLV